MAYDPFKDYFGLSSVAWGKSHLDSIMEPPACRSDADAFLINRELIVPSDPLERIRSNADVDFSHNGVVADLDTLDVYQSQLRLTGTAAEATATATLQQPTDAPRRKRGKKEKKVCVFCRNNGESSTVYKSHTLKDNLGRTTCPILRRYTCPLCRASGDTAHTIRYCPANEGGLGSGLSLLLLPDRVTAGSWPTGK